MKKMKKSVKFLIALLILIIIPIITLPIVFPDGDMSDEYESFRWTKSIRVENGVVTPAQTTAEHTVEKSGEYRISYGWAPEGIGHDDIVSMPLTDTHFLTVMRICDSNGKNVFTTSAGTIYAGTVLTLEAGQYTITYSYFTDRDSFIEYAKDYICGAKDAEDLADDIDFSIYGGNGEFPVSYELTQRSEGSTAFAIWMLLLILFLVLLILLIALVVKPKNFDERQERERGRGYRLGFLVMLTGIGIAICTDLSGVFPKTDSAIFYITAILPGVMAFAAYCIWHEAYFAMNEKATGAMVIFFFIAIFNTFVGVSHIVDGSFYEDGRISFSIVNLFCGILFIAIVITMFLKKLSSKNAASNDEED